MSFKDILIHVDSTDSAAERRASAIQIARAHEAHLTGLYVIEIPLMPMYVQVEMPNEILKQQRNACLELAEEAKKDFLEATEAAGIIAEWRCVEDNTGGALSVHSRYTDLVVLGQATGQEGTAEERLVDRVILEAPKPVLVVPTGGTGASVGQRILVAWNTSREAVRAIDGAMPLLAAASEVDVVAVNPHTSTTEHGPLPSMDICHHLTRHGVEAAAREVTAADRDAGDAILKWATDQGSDLIVMGAYGRWRISEIVLGSVTKHVLRNTKIPVLLAH